MGVALYGPYLLGVELASLLLLAGMVGAYHLGREWGDETRRQGDGATGRQRKERWIEGGNVSPSPCLLGPVAPSPVVAPFFL